MIALSGVASLSPALAVPPGPMEGELLVRVVRTGPTAVSVLGVAVTPTDTVELLVDGSVVATRTPLWNLDYWFLQVGVSDGSVVQTRIGALNSPQVPVPAYVAQPVGPPGFIYAMGPTLMLDGVPIQLFGVDEQYAFIYGMIASGLWGSPDPSAWGKNGLFPSGPDGYISGVTDADSLWREYFRYFLHYRQVAGSPGHPKPNVVRIWVADDSWNPDGTYVAWRDNPTAFWNLFDRMVYWARRANIYLVPVLGHFSASPGEPKYNEFFDPTTPQYAHQVALARAILDRYDSDPQIAMWDLWNEPDVRNDAYWASAGGIDGFRAWASQYIADVKPYSSNHLITMGIGGWTLFPGAPAFGWRYHFFFNDVPGLEVTHHHWYFSAEDEYLIAWPSDWYRASGRPHYEGEFGFNEGCVNPLCYGYWPWFTERSRATAWPAISTMVFVDNGRGAYADYPYMGPLPDYASSSFDFSLALNPSSASVLPGQSATTTATATLTGGTAQAVNFSSSGLPSGANASFDPTTCNPTCSSTLTLSTSTTVPTGTYPVTVSGSGGGLIRNATFGLTVTAPCPAAPPSYPAAAWDRVWCDSSFGGKLADAPDEAVEQFDTDWGQGPVGGIRADNIGFRSGRTIGMSTPGEYVFTLGADDGIRLWIDGTLVLDKWFQQPYALYNATRSMTGGTHELRIDYYEGPGDARVSFAYSLSGSTDGTPPAAVTDLAVPALGTQSATLRWTAPGDDGLSGTAAEYDIRYSTQGPLTETNFSAATSVASLTPSAPGTIETFDVTGLSPGTQYWFALRTSDEVPNWSGVSNSPTGTTSNSNDPPVAQFTFTPSNPHPGDAVTFDASASSDSDGVIVGFAWGFGDGGTGSGETVSHVYSSVGTYVAVLTVTDDDGLSDGHTTSVTVTPSPDTTSPAAISDLRIVSADRTAIRLAWTAPGDDGTSGRATWYDLRYSAAGPITESNFDAAVHFEIAFPQPAGTGELADVTALSPGTRYWFAVKASDEVPNWSPVSNVVDATTQAEPEIDTTAPNAGISTPVDGSKVRGDVQVSAWATDDTAVGAVSFYSDQTLIGVALAPPYSWTWPSSQVRNGPHQLMVVASDASGNLGTAAITIRVGNAPRVKSALWDPARSVVEIVFSLPMNRTSVDGNLLVEPAADHASMWPDVDRLLLSLAGVPIEGQTYAVTIGTSATDTEGEPMETPFRFEFVPAPRTSLPVSDAIVGLGLLAGAFLVVLAPVAAHRRRRTHRRTAARLDTDPVQSEPVRRDGTHDTPRHTEDAAAINEPTRTGLMHEPATTEPPDVDMIGFEAWLDEIEAEVTALATGSATPASPNSGVRNRSEPTLLAFEDRPLLGSVKTSVPRAGAWTEFRARSAVEKYLRGRPLARAADIAKDLGMDLGLATRVTTCLRSNRSA